MNDIYREISGRRQCGEPTVLATVVGAQGSTPRKPGAKMLVLAGGQTTGTVGGGSLEHQVHQEALRLMGTGSSCLKHFELTNEDAAEQGMVCGGTIDVFIESINPSSVLVLFGAGHITLTLAQLGKMLDFEVVVIDDRPEFANRQRFPYVDEIIVGEMASSISRLDINASSYIVIVTRGHQNDAEVLEQVITTPAAYIGMIGSKKKVQSVYSYLESRGITSDQLSRVHSPIGLRIGAETPEEIAISIMAEIIQDRRRTERETSHVEEISSYDDPQPSGSNNS